MQNLLSSRLLSKNLKIKIYRTIILPVVLYRCETWSLTLQEERKLSVSENMVLRRIIVPRRDEVMGEWRRLYNEELLTQYCAGDKIEKNEMGWACGAFGWGEGGCIRSWWGDRRERDHRGDLRIDGWIILGWISRRWDNNIKHLFTAIGLLPGGSGYFTCKQNMKLVTTRFKSGRLHEKHVVATWNLGNHLSICL